MYYTQVALMLQQERSGTMALPIGTLLLLIILIILLILLGASLLAAKFVEILSK